MHCPVSHCWCGQWMRWRVERTMDMTVFHERRADRTMSSTLGTGSEQRWLRAKEMTLTRWTVQVVLSAPSADIYPAERLNPPSDCVRDFSFVFLSSSYSTFHTHLLGDFLRLKLV